MAVLENTQTHLLSGLCKKYWVYLRTAHQDCLSVFSWQKKCRDFPTCPARSCMYWQPWLWVLCAHHPSSVHSSCCLFISIPEMLCGMFLSLLHSHCGGVSLLFYRQGGRGQNKCSVNLVFLAKILTLHTMKLPILKKAEGPWN